MSGSGLTAKASEFIPASHEAEMRRLRQSNKDLKKAIVGMKEHKRHMEKYVLSLQKKNGELELESKGLGEEQHRQAWRKQKEIEVLKQECEKSKKLAEERRQAWVKINDSYIKLQGDAMRSTREAREGRDTIERLRASIENMRTTVNNQNRLLVVDRGKLEKWQRASLRLDWLIREMDKVGAIRLPDHDWATDMRHDIEYPDDDGMNRGKSIYGDINVAIRRDCLPDYGDADIEAVGEEEEHRRYEEWSQEASAYVASLESAENGNDMELKIAAAECIQRYYRGFRSRGHITFTYARCDGEPALRAVQVVSEGRETWSRQEHIFLSESCDPTRFMRRNIVVEDAMVIRLVNTGADSFKLNWLNRRGGLGKSFKIGPRSYFRSEEIKTYHSHCALITNMRTNTMKIVRMSKVHGIRVMGMWDGKYRSLYDVNTNLTLPSIQSVISNLRARNYYYNDDKTDAEFFHSENYGDSGNPFFSAKLQYVVPELVQPYWKCLGYDIRLTEDVEILGISDMFDEEAAALQRRRDMGGMIWTDDVEDYEISDLFEEEEEDEANRTNFMGIFSYRRVWRINSNTGEEQEMMCVCGGVGPCMQCGLWQMIMR